MDNDVNALIEKMRQKTKELKEAKLELFNQEKDKGYLMNDGTYFTIKMLMDLRMWNDLSREYGYDKKGILALKRDLDELNIYRQRYGSII